MKCIVISDKTIFEKYNRIKAIVHSDFPDMKQTEQNCIKVLLDNYEVMKLGKSTTDKPN